MNPEVFDEPTLAMLGGMTLFGIGMALVAGRSRWQARRQERSMADDPARWGAGPPEGRPSRPPGAGGSGKLAG